MQEIRFKVQGSAPEPYEVVFIRRSQQNLSAYCSCPAGEYGQHCKHRIDILTGSAKGIVGSNRGEIKTVQSWLTGTDVEVAILQMLKFEKELEKTKKALAAAKKNLARAMLD